MAIDNVLPIAAAAKPATKGKTARKPAAERKSRTSFSQRAAYAAAGVIGTIAAAATFLSLTDLSDTIQSLAHVEAWRAWALALAIDTNFIATEALTIFSTEAQRKRTMWPASATKAITLIGSALANAFSMAHLEAPFSLPWFADVAAGFAIPALVALATLTLGRAVRA